MSNASFLSNEEYDKRDCLAYQLVNKDCWEAVDCIDSFLHIFDKMPKQMKIIVDFKVEGKTNKEIADHLQITESHVRSQLCIAKKRMVTALF
jgi:DNA-binding NarL/FixJ family response regulator